MSSHGRPTPLLIVEDELQVREVLVEFFTNLGYAVSIASTGSEAMKFIKQKDELAIVLLDIMLPGAGGIEILKALKVRHPQSVVIILTSIADREIAKQAIALGAFDYVMKPPILKDLEILIRASESAWLYRKEG